MSFCKTSSSSGSTSIHSTAIVDSAAELGRGVSVGPYSVIGPHVRLGDGCSVGAHVVLSGYTSLDVGCKVFPFASIGGAPQDLKYHDEPSTLVIGKRNVIREYVTIHPGTESGQMTTVVGDDNLFMVSSHVAHDCIVGSRNVFANGVALAGHVTVGSGAILGGLCAIHQFSRIGDLSMISGGSMVARDVPPYAMVQGDRARIRGINIIGLRRAGFKNDEISAIKRAYRHLFVGVGSPVYKASSLPDDLLSYERIAEMRDFVLATKRGFIGLRKVEDSSDA